MTKSGAAAPSSSTGHRNALIAYSAFALLVATNVATGVGLLMAPEIATLFHSEEDASTSIYEQRILALRMEVDRLHSRQYRQTGDLNLQMQELAQQQQFLAEQHSFVRILAEKAENLGLAPDLNEDMTATVEANMVQPVNLQIGTDSASQPQTTMNIPVDGSLQDIQLDVRAMVTESRLALAAIAAKAEDSTNQIMSGLRDIGIRPNLPDAETLASGGPLLPPSDQPFDESLADEANRVMLALERFATARQSLQAAPIHYPFSSARSISSPFGNRRDPFGGNAAFHSGIDFPAPTGTPILSAGPGKVIYAGRRSGYGIVVEIDHNGIVTRYAHMSAFLVNRGDTVLAGQQIGKVGSTGRSTGPHLHFEVRLNDEPKNPMTYLNIAGRLEEFLI